MTPTAPTAPTVPTALNTPNTAPASPKGSADRAAQVAPGCTLPPPAPPQGSSDWAAAVHPNCFDDLERVGLWTAGTYPVARGASPSKFIQPMRGAQVGAAAAGAAGVTAYVVAHGWAPGYRAAVEAAGGRLRWWDDGASANGVWASDWAWCQVSGDDPPLGVNPTGLFQSIKAFDPTSWVFAYSWIDDSATDSGWYNLGEVYESEAYTQINGIRLANALLRLFVPQFWTNPSNRLHLIGHSHGSKVVTVAALALRNLGLPVAQLSILDAPESESTRAANGANFLGFFLEQMAIADPTAPSAGGTVVDNYPSYFGVAYGGAPALSRVVDVALDPSKIYAWDDAGDQHTYAAAWYGAAAAAARSYKLPNAGLAVPPPQIPYRPALLQTWPYGTTQISQWPLATGTPPHAATYAAPSVAIDVLATIGNVSGTPASGLVFGAPATPGTYSMFQGGYKNSVTSGGFGLAVDVSWQGAVAGDYLVFTAESGTERTQEVVLVLDGRSGPFPPVTYSLTLAADASNIPFTDLWFYVFYFPAAGNTAGTVTVSNFRRVVVG